MFFKERFKINLDLLFCEHVVVILCSNRFVKIMFFTDRKSTVDNFRVPVASSPVEAESFLNNLMKSSANFLEWGCVVMDMGIQNIHIFKLKSR